MQNIILFIGTPEVIFVLFIVIMVFGADKIPEIAKGLAKGIRQVKDATTDIKSEITKSADHHLKDLGKDELKKDIDKVKGEIEEITGSVKRKL